MTSLISLQPSRVNWCPKTSIYRISLEGALDCSPFGVQTTDSAIRRRFITVHKDDFLLHAHMSFHVRSCFWIVHLRICWFRNANCRKWTLEIRFVPVFCSNCFYLWNISTFLEHESYSATCSITFRLCPALWQNASSNPPPELILHVLPGRRLDTLDTSFNLIMSRLSSSPGLVSNVVVTVLNLSGRLRIIMATCRFLFNSKSIHRQPLENRPWSLRDLQRHRCRNTVC